MKKPILKVKKLSSGFYIYFDTYSKNFFELKEGMEFRGDIEEGKIVLREIKK